jgi:hypothetical protein
MTGVCLTHLLSVSQALLHNLLSDIAQRPRRVTTHAA